MFILWFRKARSGRRVFEDLIYELVEIQNTVYHCERIDYTLKIKAIIFM